ncbi:phospholipase [Actinoplanes sp. G11-F43]|uniref:phospholipase n=1 Tax=Actinoplanes sp. G11-F43 TaxID=3424130 RepID=UPI003D342B8C
MSIGHGDHHHHHHTLAPSGQGTVMLDIGDGIGALIIHTPSWLHGHEIEVSPVDDTSARTHAAVRARYVRSGVTYCVVIDSLAEGRYVVWQDDDTPLTQVDVRGGAVAEVTWPANVVPGRTPVAV